VIRTFFGRRTLEQSFAISTALLVILLVGITMIGVHTRVAAVLQHSLAARGQAIARSIGAVATPSLLAYNYPALQVAADGAEGDEDIVYVVIQDKEGKVAGQAGRRSRPADSVAEAPAEDIVVLERTIASVGGGLEEVLEVAVPVRVEGVADPWGTVRVGLSMHGTAASLQRIDIGLLGLGLALGVLAVAAGRWVAGKITAPLRTLAAATASVSYGKMDRRVPVEGSREFADLARALNEMMDRVQEKAEESDRFQNALEALNATLEEQVHLRTMALRESEEQYKSLVEDSPDAILIIQDERVRFVNRAFQEIFGVSEEEALSSNFRLDDTLDSSSSALVRKWLDDLEQGRMVRPTEIVGWHRSGHALRLELRGSRIEYRGKPAAECILVDTTEAKALREHLEETERLRALGELAGGVAHDFNNLLSAILGRVQLLRRRGFDTDVDSALAIIETAAQDGRETVRRIQEFARTRRERRFSPVSIPAILRDAAEITRTRWQSEAANRSVTFDVTLDTHDVPAVLGNAAELREVFTNLVLNAVDAMPAGGRLNLSCQHEEGSVRAIVADNGEGMSEQVRKRLFDPFFSTKGTGGMGLGLAMVYGIVTRHEGTIEVETERGKGTRFVLEFPVCHESEASAGESVVAADEPGCSARILVIDDEPEIADVLKDVLVAHGHQVMVALSGRKGVELAERETLDLVFTDLGMPDMTGWEVAARIGACRPELPVALVTGWASSLDENEVLRKGIAAVVHKPFEIDEVARATREILTAADRARARRAG
jgi:PAS domain S-box-containing protein